MYQGVDDCIGAPSAGFEPPISMETLISEALEIIGFSTVLTVWLECRMSW